MQSLRQRMAPRTFLKRLASVRKTSRQQPDIAERDNALSLLPKRTAKVSEEASPSEMSACTLCATRVNDGAAGETASALPHPGAVGADVGGELHVLGDCVSCKTVLHHGQRVLPTDRNGWRRS
jgi:hypothetical protein